MKTRIRKLGNDKWIAEIRVWRLWPMWEACDVKEPEYLWGPGHYSYCFCDTEEQARKVLVETLAERYGV